MATDVEQYQSIRSQTLAELASLSENPKPTYWIDGQRVYWQEHAESLQRRVAWCDQKIAETQPFEVRSEGATE